MNQCQSYRAYERTQHCGHHSPLDEAESEDSWATLSAIHVRVEDGARAYLEWFGEWSAAKQRLAGREGGVT
jgi:hypothetical protein